MNLQVNNEYQDLVFPLSPQEYSSLKDSIQSNGQYVPIVVNSQGVIRDGHHRYKICKELLLDPVTEVKSFPDKLSEQLFVIDCNLKRRHLNSFQRVELALKSKPILEEIAKRK